MTFWASSSSKTRLKPLPTLYRPLRKSSASASR